MPIANCIVTQDCEKSAGNLVELWSMESGKASDNMTVNIVSSSLQSGNRYAVMANLQLPSMWSASDISALQRGLARALTKFYGLSKDQVHVITTIVNSGMVVENDEELKW